MEQKIDLLTKMLSDFRNDNRDEHRSIIAQAKITNSRVTKLELWKAGLIGAWTIITLIVIPTAFIVLRNYL